MVDGVGAAGLCFGGRFAVKQRGRVAAQASFHGTLPKKIVRAGKTSSRTG
ncbi:dienelactone hydrolase family protein [Bradyrhizobium sp. Cp5.3]